MARTDSVKEAEGIMAIPGATDNIDSATFEQILEMDDDEEEREFSKSIVYDFFGQAESTFQKMNKELCIYTHTQREATADTHHSENKDLKTLSELGHFLKGSSATLGLTKVKDSCEKIQHYGQKKDETGTKDLADDDEALGKLKVTIKEAQEEFVTVEKVLRKFYHDEG
ncbi:histidine-phosphotransfer domain, HPT domain-containing protein [Amniculicola lignicola CBS 123094]|uniref:Histidine-phosphotransfer domain, HPT domain-containing protein n=1 Tax=Amniculicola lignicola CBS 123094 TaxID=1392246 RepID=A0A6A5WU32_9PLEO|nr:histidine-phosphotransfer domain, HPT domain-containing protein [Amniculicola lignicola CBS 123094]